jgi:hypothetical protein
MGGFREKPNRAGRISGYRQDTPQKFKVNGMKWNPICTSCLKDCKQPSSVTMISCPAFAKAEKNLELFDMKGKVKIKSVNPTEKKKKKLREVKGPKRKI